MISTVRVLINPRSGSAGDRREQAERIRQLFQKQGIAAEVTTLGHGLDATRLASEAVEAGTGIVVAGGGDGTINAVASGLVGKDAILGVLPLGTLNHFAKDLKIPASIEEAVGVIARQHTIRVDVGELNGQIFLNNSGLGLYPSIVIQREQMKKVGLNKWVSLSFAAVRAFVRLPRLRITLTGDGQEVELVTPFVFIGNNRYEVQGARLGERKSLTGGQLFLSIAPGINRLGLLRLTFSALGSGLKNSDCFEQRCVEQFSIHSRHRKSRVSIAKVSIDGEVRRIPYPLNYRSRQGALRVCVPEAPSTE